ADAAASQGPRAGVRAGAVGRRRPGLRRPRARERSRAPGRAAGRRPVRRTADGCAPGRGTAVRPTTWRLLLGLAVIGFVLSWAVLTVGESRTGIIPDRPVPSAALLVGAAGLVLERLLRLPEPPPGADQPEGSARAD